MAGRPVTQERTKQRNLREFRHARTMSLRSKHMCKWQDPEAMEEAVMEYFADCDKRKVSYTVSGIAWWLGFSSRMSIQDQCGRDDECGEVMRRAALRIEMQRNEQLVDGSETPPQAKIFDLKANFHWQEPAQVQEINNPDGNMGNKVVAVLPDQPLNLQEWQSWYQDMMGSRNSPEPIDVEPSGEE